MGCNCGGGRRPAARTGKPRTPQDGDWVAHPPKGDPVVFTGPAARRQAQRHAIATGGTWYRHTSTDNP